MSENRFDPFSGVTNAERLSEEDKRRLLAEARAGMPPQEKDFPTSVLVVSDILTFVVVAVLCYLALIYVLGNSTSALL
ncbi:hypothetical protein AGMMS49975_10120 [Clostridia bacterium]|nr:hypothetical protein AGMMS49975_10120 [Clostridia bacterium]